MPLRSATVSPRAARRIGVIVWIVVAIRLTMTTGVRNSAHIARPPHGVGRYRRGADEHDEGHRLDHVAQGRGHADADRERDRGVVEATEEEGGNDDAERVQ